MNKRGQADPLVDVFMFFAVILLFVVFGVVFSFMTENHVFKLEENKETIDAKILLPQILRTPVEIEGYNTDYADYIALGYFDESLRGEVKDDLQGTLNKIVSRTNITAARLIISDYKTGLGGQMVITTGDINKNVDAPSNSYDAKHFGTCIMKVPAYKNREIKISLIVKNGK